MCVMHSRQGEGEEAPKEPSDREAVCGVRRPSAAQVNGDAATAASPLSPMRVERYSSGRMSICRIGWLVCTLRSCSRSSLVLSWPQLIGLSSRPPPASSGTSA